MEQTIRPTANREERLIRVVVTNLADKAVVHDRIIDYNFKHDRTWLAKTVTWGLYNNHSILSKPFEDEE